MSFLNNLYIKFLATARSENGQTLIEYAFLLLLIAIVVILMVKGLGGTANNTFSKVNSAFQ
jgi:pilus assembly protein Flp/PilA